MIVDGVSGFHGHHATLHASVSRTLQVGSFSRLVLCIEKIMKTRDYM